MEKLGDWRWYCGADEDDDEMCECASREDAIRHGRFAMAGDVFFIVEARMTVAHEKAMGDGKRDAAPFAEKRNGEFIEPLARVKDQTP